MDNYQNLGAFADGIGTEVGWALVLAVDAKTSAMNAEAMVP